MIQIQIKIVGTNCSNGMKLSKMVNRAIEEAECEVSVETLDDSSKHKYGIRNVPALLINGNIVSEGKVLTVREIKKLILA